MFHWLCEYAPPPKLRKGYVTPQTNLKNNLLKLHIEAGYRGTIVKTVKGVKTKQVFNPKNSTWPQDILRHSFASHWLPIHQNRSVLAEEMGNSVQIIKKHYRKHASKSAAAAFWEILPAAESARRAEAMEAAETEEAERNEDWGAVPEIMEEGPEF